MSIVVFVKFFVNHQKQIVKIWNLCNKIRIWIRKKSILDTAKLILFQMIRLEFMLRYFMVFLYSLIFFSKTRILRNLEKIWSYFDYSGIPYSKARSHILIKHCLFYSTILWQRPRSTTNFKMPTHISYLPSVCDQWMSEKKFRIQNLALAEKFSKILYTWKNAFWKLQKQKFRGKSRILGRKSEIHWSCILLDTALDSHISLLRLYKFLKKDYCR